MSVQNAGPSSQPPLSERQRAALISLLADDDPAIESQVRDKILAYGPISLDWLRSYHVHPDPVLRKRTQEIVDRFDRQATDTDFLEFCQHTGEDLDLELGVGLLAKTKTPQANWDAYRAQWDEWAQDVRSQTLGIHSIPQLLSQLNQVLFHQLRFRGHAQYSLHPECSYLNEVMDRRMGNPIGLCTVFLLVARRIGLPVAGIGLPGHFVCRLQSPTFETYIDCFNQGRLLTKKDCIEHIRVANPTADRSYLSPVSPRRILMRMCANLQQTYYLNDLEEALRMNRYLDALAN